MRRKFPPQERAMALLEITQLKLAHISNIVNQKIPKIKNSRPFLRSGVGGRYRTRTCDPPHVKRMLIPAELIVRFASKRYFNSCLRKCQHFFLKIAANIHRGRRSGRRRAWRSAGGRPRPPRRGPWCPRSRWCRPCSRSAPPLRSAARRD